jgi:hypothetical protein
MFPKYRELKDYGAYSQAINFVLYSLFSLVFIFAVLKIKPRALCMLGKSSTLSYTPSNPEYIFYAK